MFMVLVIIVVEGTRMVTMVEGLSFVISLMVGSFSVVVTLFFGIVVVEVAWVVVRSTEISPLSVLVVINVFLAETLFASMLRHAILVSGMVALTLASVALASVTLTFVSLISALALSFVVMVISSAATSLFTTCFHDIRRANFIGNPSRTVQ